MQSADGRTRPLSSNAVLVLIQACNLQVQEDKDYLLQCQGYASLPDKRSTSNINSEPVAFYRRVKTRSKQQGWV